LKKIDNDISTLEKLYNNLIKDLEINDKKYDKNNENITKNVYNWSIDLKVKYEKLIENYCYIIEKLKNVKIKTKNPMSIVQSHRDDIV